MCSVFPNDRANSFELQLFGQFNGSDAANQLDYKMKIHKYCGARLQ